jgi:hypothetical protein
MTTSPSSVRELSSVSATKFGTSMRARLLTPAELAEWLAVDRSWVYEHAEELGALRLGAGPKARLRFDLEAVKCCLGGTSCSEGRESDDGEPAQQALSRRRRRRATGTTVELLPVRGRSEAA